MKILSVTNRGRRILQRGVIPAAAVAGAALVTVGLATQHSAPQAPSATAATSSSGPAGTHRASPGQHHTANRAHHPTTKIKTSSAPGKHKTAADKSGTTKTGKKTTKKQASHHVLPASQPTRLQVPGIDVDTDVTKVGRTSSDQIGVPKGSHIDDAAWFDESPTPGQYGPSVIVGHIDTDHGRSVFFQLGKLRHGDTIHVTRKDGTKATFTVDTARSYPDRKKLPTARFLGGNVDQSGLKLVTCTDFDHKTGHYLGNTIISAHLDQKH